MRQQAPGVQGAVPRRRRSASEQLRASEAPLGGGGLAFPDAVVNIVWSASRAGQTHWVGLVACLASSEARPRGANSHRQGCAGGRRVGPFPGAPPRSLRRFPRKRRPPRIPPRPDQRCRPPRHTHRTGAFRATNYSSYHRTPKTLPTHGPTGQQIHADPAREPGTLALPPPRSTPSRWSTLSPPHHTPPTDAHPMLLPVSATVVREASVLPCCAKLCAGPQ